jgi:hypothetical protein
LAPVEVPAAISIPALREAASEAVAAPSAVSLYRITDLTAFPTDSARFFDFDYRDTLCAMIEAVIEVESPMRTDILCQRIARAHGWSRTGSRIRERIELHLRDYDRTMESSGEFIWKAGAVAEIHPYRAPASDEARRSIPDVPLAELAAMARNNPGLLDEPDPARELARLLGVERLAAASRLRLEEAITRAQGAAPAKAEG